MLGFHARDFHYPPKDILHDKGAKISHVSPPVNGGSTAVEPKALAIHRFESLDRSGQGVE
jgi:hypothetical protein|tara:strand:- start:818 stop:997 length:180 start_codon:yes stop_codon:yes gene_type:complete